MAQSSLPQNSVDGSTAPAPAPAVLQQNNLTLNLSKNSDYSRVGLDYSIKWDFSDLASFKPGIGALASGVRAIYSWDITKNTRLNYYGFKTNPWRVILADREKVADYGSPETTGEGGGGVVNRAGPGSRKHLRLSLSPLVDDFKLNFEENFRTMLLKGSLKNVSPQWERAGTQGRREFVRDVLSLGIWDAPMPGVGQGRRGLEYLSR